MALVFNPFTGNFDNVMASSSDMSFSGGSLNVNGDITLDSGGDFTTTVQAVTPTANRTISFPDQTGTVGLVSGATGNIQYNNAGQLAGTGDFNVDLNWTDAGVTYTGLKVNVTDTASAADSNLVDIQSNGASKFTFNPAGVLDLAGSTVSGGLAFGGGFYGFQSSFEWTFKNPNGFIGFAAANSSADVALKRSTANIIEITNGSTGTGYLKQTPIPFGNLAAMSNAAYDGARAMISDGPASPTFGGTASGGGTRTLPVFSDGTNWYFG